MWFRRRQAVVAPPPAPRITIPPVETPSLEVMRRLYLRKPADIPIGFLALGHNQLRRLYYPKELSAGIVAPPGWGKTYRALGHTCLMYPGTLAVFDPKGELAAISARWRSQVLGHRVNILNPFKLHQEIPHMRSLARRMNPLARAIPGRADFTTRIRAIADAVIVQANDRSNASFFTAGGRAVFQGVAEALRWHNPKTTLYDVFNVIAAGRSEWEAVMWAFKSSPSANARRLANKFLGEDRDSIHDQREDVRTQLEELLGDEQIQDFLSDDEFDWWDKKNPEPSSTFLVLPATQSKNATRFARLMIGGLKTALGQAPRRSVLVILDEVATALSENEQQTVLEMVNGLRGHGVRTQVVFQSFAQMKRIYDNHPAEMEAGLGCLQFMQPSDKETIEYLVDRGGHKEAVYYTSSRSFTHTSNNKDGESASTNDTLTMHKVKVPVLEDVLLRDMSPLRQIIFTQGSGYPLTLAANIPYDHAFAGLQGRYDPNPFAPDYEPPPVVEEPLPPPPDMSAFNERWDMAAAMLRGELTPEDFQKIAGLNKNPPKRKTTHQGGRPRSAT